MNTGENGAICIRRMTATNGVLHDAEHASVLVLPVVE